MQVVHYGMCLSEVAFQNTFFDISFQDLLYRIIQCRASIVFMTSPCIIGK